MPDDSMWPVTDDLVARMYEDVFDDDVYFAPNPAKAIMRKAAERITTLERELAEARAKEPRVGALAAIAEIREVTGLSAKPMLSELAGAVQVLLSKYAHAADTAKAERDASQAEVERLRAALEPFEDVSGEGDEDYPDDTKVVVTFGRTTFYALRLGDFRRARAALTRQGETG